MNRSKMSDNETTFSKKAEKEVLKKKQKTSILLLKTLTQFRKLMIIISFNNNFNRKNKKISIYNKKINFGIIGKEKYFHLLITYSF